MNDHDKLAQRIVAQGVGMIPIGSTRKRYFPPKARTCKHAEQFCTDGRVVLALMEKVGDFVLERSNGGLSLATLYETYQPGTFWERGKSITEQSLALAIVTACLDALEGE